MITVVIVVKYCSSTRCGSRRGDGDLPKRGNIGGAFILVFFASIIVCFSSSLSIYRRVAKRNRGHARDPRMVAGHGHYTFRERRRGRVEHENQKPSKVGVPPVE